MANPPMTAKRRNHEPNHVINHIAVVVPDVEAATEFYTSVLGFRKLAQNLRVVDRSKTPDAQIFKIYGDRFNVVKIAMLTTGNGVGYELFEFIDPPMKEWASFDVTRGGVFHIAVTDSDPEELCRRVIAAGGNKIGGTVKPYDHLDENDCALYMQDPWGTVIEVLSCSFEELMSNR
ncbi:hypothetical protein CLAIMM_09762 [Cladophialophora immunda]|nr:hypothetical protein CLAIMM_09762 [Cladophialophora immunda]